MSSDAAGNSPSKGKRPQKFLLPSDFAEEKGKPENSLGLLVSLFGENIKDLQNEEKKKEEPEPEIISCQDNSEIYHVDKAPEILEKFDFENYIRENLNLKGGKLFSQHSASLSQALQQDIGAEKEAALQAFRNITGFMKDRKSGKVQLTNFHFF